MTKRSFPDVNVWFALAVADHPHHRPALAWWNEESSLAGFSRLTQLGLLRLLTTGSAMGGQPLTNEEAWRVYDGFLSDSRVRVFPELPALEDLFRSLFEPPPGFPQGVGGCVSGGARGGQPGHSGLVRSSLQELWCRMPDPDLNRAGQLCFCRCNRVQWLDYSERRRAEPPTGHVHRPRALPGKTGRLGLLRHRVITALVPCPAPLDQVLRLVLDSVSSPSTRTMYSKALADFSTGARSREVRLFRAPPSRPTAPRLRASHTRPRPSTSAWRPSRNQRARTAANGLLDAGMAAAIDKARLRPAAGRQGREFAYPNRTPRRSSMPRIPPRSKGKRDRALLALLVGCGLRCAEAVALTFDHILAARRPLGDVDLRGKHGRLRSIAVPAGPAAVDLWRDAASLTERRILARSTVTAASRATSFSQPFSPSRFYGAKLGLRLRPHDLRDCAKLCRKRGRGTRAIQLLLGHASIQNHRCDYLGHVAEPGRRAERPARPRMEGLTPNRPGNFGRLYGTAML